jgi:hypothetical protein
VQNPVPLQPSEDSIQPFTRNKYLGFSILVGFLYGIPTLLLAFAVSFLLQTYFSMIFFILPNRVITYGVPGFIGLMSAIISGIVSGRASFKSANQDGTPRPVGYGILSCAGIGLIGLLVFPILCGVGDFLVLSVLDKFSLLNDQLSALLLGGGTAESGLFMVVFTFLIPIGAALAYITAVLFGGLIYLRLSRKNSPAKKLP